MTEQEKVDIVSYIEAKVSPLARDLSRIENKVDALFSKINSVQSQDDRDAGAQAMKATIWKAAAAIVAALTAVAAVLTAAIT